MADHVIAGTVDMSRIQARVSGQRRVVQRLIRKLNMPRGSSCADRNIGFDVADAIQDTMTLGDSARLKAAVKAELENDDDVRTATVTGDFDQKTKRFPLRIVAVGPKVSVTFSAVATQQGVALEDE